jgi:hypothetical protein
VDATKRRSATTPEILESRGDLGSVLFEIVERLARVEEQLERLSRRGEDTAAEIMVLLDRLRFRLEDQQPGPLSLTATAPPAAPDEPPSPRVVLSGPGKPPLVLGKKKPVLTPARYNVVQALLDAGEGGLGKDELDKKSGHTDARKILKAVADSDPDWASVIHFPVRKGKGYRVW